MANWFLSPALATLLAQVNAQYPNRERQSDGTIGDAAHAARSSDHNPDWDSGGIVRALDLTANGIPVAELIRHIIADKRVRYVISNGLIWQTVDPHWRRYTGPNPHDKHFHISIRNVNGYDLDDSQWDLGMEPSMELSDADVERIAKATARKVWDQRIAVPPNLEAALGERAPALKFLRAIAFRVEKLYREPR
jgi:hypothetical protein